LPKSPLEHLCAVNYDPICLCRVASSSRFHLPCSSPSFRFFFSRLPLFPFSLATRSSFFFPVPPHGTPGAHLPSSFPYVPFTAFSLFPAYFFLFPVRFALLRRLSLMTKLALDLFPPMAISRFLPDLPVSPLPKGRYFGVLAPRPPQLRRSPSQFVFFIPLQARIEVEVCPPSPISGFLLCCHARHPIPTIPRAFPLSRRFPVSFIPFLKSHSFNIRPPSSFGSIRDTVLVDHTARFPVVASTDFLLF